jgi:uncharacterized membrane protein YgcG
VDGRTTAANMNTYILESPTLTGPFKLVTYMKDFGVQAYFCNFPSKFIAGDGNSAWLWYSANFHPLERESNPPGSGYHLCSREVLIQRAVHSNPASGGGSGGGGGTGGNGGSSTGGGSATSEKDSHGDMYRWCFGAVEAPIGVRGWTLFALLAALGWALRRR